MSGVSSAIAHRLTGRAAALIGFETVLLVAAVGAAAYVRLGDWMWPILWEEGGLWKALLVAAVCQVCLYYSDLYDVRILSDRREIFVRIVRALGAASFILAAIYFWFPWLVLGRGVFLIATAAVVGLVVAWRIAFEWLSGHVAPRERLLLVGTGSAGVALAHELHDRRHELGVDIAGFVSAEAERVGETVFNPGVIGTIEDIPSIVRARNIDRVVVSLVDARGKLPMDKLLDMKLDGVCFDYLPSVYQEYTGKIAVENLRPSWLIFSSGFRKSRLHAAAKRLLDVTGAALGLMLALPVMVLVALAIKVSSSGPVMYHQHRVGLRGRVFTLHKFRSMRDDAESATGPVWASDEDPRITPVGRFLRRTRLDELPQLWNVFIGDMSLVGPRPERPEFVSALTREIPFYGQRHVVRPGLTGWAQVRYTYGASKEDALEKLQYDLYYIKNTSLPFDLFVLLQTIKTVILQKGA